MLNIAVIPQNCIPLRLWRFSGAFRTCRTLNKKWSPGRLVYGLRTSSLRSKTCNIRAYALALSPYRGSSSLPSRWFCSSPHSSFWGNRGSRVTVGGSVKWEHIPVLPLIKEEKNGTPVARCPELDRHGPEVLITIDRTGKDKPWTNALRIAGKRPSWRFYLD